MSKSAHSRVDKHTYSADIENDCVVFTSVAMSVGRNAASSTKLYSADIENATRFYE